MRQSELPYIPTNLSGRVEVKCKDTFGRTSAATMVLLQSHYLFCEGKVTEWSNVETSLKNVGISLRESTGEFRDFDEVIDETASRWDSFSEVTQRSIASSFAGTHHMNEFLVLMQNYSKAQEYMQIATNSSGESLKKYEAYTDSAAGKLEGFANSFQSLSTVAIDSDIFKGVIDSGTALLNILTQIIDIGGGIPAVLGTIAGVKLFKNLD